MIKKNIVYVFFAAMLIYFASVGVYLINSIYMLNGRVLLAAKILMVCSLCVFLLIALGLKTIAKNEEITQSKMELFGRFEFFSKICTMFSIGVLVMLLIRDVICS